MATTRSALSTPAAWQRAIMLAAPVVVLLTCFGRALFCRETFVFRDSSHYYFPLWQWITRQWRWGEFPLWNPYENAGMPLAADATASLFYPGKLLFLLPLPFDVAYNLFLIGHFVLAFWLTWRAARTFKLTPQAAALAALAYTFSGSVLIQHANAPYLIGAAWLPLAFSGGYLLLRERSWRGASHFALALAMMVLGGDVQSAYHCLLMLFVGCWFVPSERATHDAKPVPWHRWRITLIVGCCLLAGGLAAVQILPARAETPLTMRAAFDHPRNVYEAGSLLLANDADDPAAARLAKIKQGLFGTPIPRSHHEASYQFSVGPWRWPELLWPNVSGRMFPVHQRWLNAIPAEGRVWSPSLYLGAIPLLLALSVLRLRKGKPHIRWLSAIVVLSIVAALGWNGIGWIVHEITYATAGSAENEPAIGPQVGGLYWLFSTLLPGYAYFRYPAKWMTIASLAISLLAGYGLQLNARRLTRRMRRLLLGAIGTSVVGVALLWLFHRSWQTALHSAPVDPYFGPLDIEGAWHGCLTGFAQTTFVGIVAYGLLSLRHARVARCAAIVLLSITAVDLAFAQHWLTPTAPASLWQQRPEVFYQIRFNNEATSPRIYRSRSPRLLPAEFSQTSSADRLVEGMIWERDSLHAKHYLTHEIGSIDVPATMRTERHTDQMETLAHDSDSEIRDRNLADLAVTDWIGPAGSPQSVEFAASKPLVEQPHIAHARIDSPRPRAYLVRNDEHVDESIARMAIMSDSPNRIEMQVFLTAPATLIVCDSYSADWRAELVTDNERRAVKIDRAGELFRSVALPAGEHRLVMSFLPRSVVIGGVVSLLSWGMLLMLLIVRRRHVIRRNLRFVFKGT